MGMKWSRTCTAAAKTRLWPAGARSFLTVTRGFGPAGLYSSAVEWTLSALGFFCVTCPLTLGGRLNDYLLSTVLGIIEGLTEFLPVSSTAHLRIAQALLGTDLTNGYWEMFSIVIQLGAILCLPIYFWSRIMTFLATYPKGKAGDKTAITHPLALTLLAFVATSATSLPLQKLIGKNLQNLVVMGTALVVGGVVMWIVDAIYGARKGASFE